MSGILIVTQDIYSDLHEAFVIAIQLYWSEREQLVLLLLFWMCHLGYLVSSVTTVASLLMHSRLLCGEGL